MISTGELAARAASEGAGLKPSTGALTMTLEEASACALRQDLDRMRISDSKDVSSSTFCEGGPTASDLAGYRDLKQHIKRTFEGKNRTHLLLSR